MTGSVYQRRDGRWVSAMPVDGKRRLRYSRTEDEANDKLAQMGGERRGESPVLAALRRSLEDSECECGEVHAEEVRRLLLANGVRLVPYRRRSNARIAVRGEGRSA